MSKFEAAADALRYMNGGRATITVTSHKTGKHYTYKVRQAKSQDGIKPPFFVSVLAGPSNETDYTYLGFLAADTSNARTLIAGRKGKPDAITFKAFSWVLHQLQVAALSGVAPEALGFSVQHEGTCCRCGRKLTVPSSIASGIGPECAAKMEA